MSLQYSDLSTYKGIVQIYEKEIGAERGFVSGNTDRLKELTADVNLALDDFIALAIKSSGTWQYDDSNHSDYPIITTNLVSGQRDYSFTTDGSGNLILDIYRVVIKKSSSGQYVDINPVDVQSQVNNTGFYDGNNVGGRPTKYDKTANGIFLDPIPNYNATSGLKVYINREASYFTYSDTTKKPGVPGIFHRYFALKPALDYARRHNLSNKNDLEKEVLSYEGDDRLSITGSIKDYFSQRPRDERKRFTISNESCR